MAEPWWKSAVIYQIYPRSFADSNGDGVGDLEGIRRHLDHLSWLGVDAIWLSPIYRSPMDDFGYDVSDHCDVDPVFGTLDDFDRLLAEAHERGIRVLLDWVPNHTSDQHPWFVDARSGRDSPRRSWYVWRDGSDDGGPPNNWRAAFETDASGRFKTAWALDPATDQWYLHLFLPSQPDLNWGEPAVVEAMHGVLRFWLDRGVDGLRADVIHCIGKDPRLPDDPPSLAEIPKSATNDDPSTHELLRDIRSLLDGYPGERMMVGEVYLLDTARVATYYGAGDELHLAFNFPPLYTRWEAPAWRKRVQEVLDHFGPVAGWPTWVLSNHDNRRHRTRYGSEARARAAAVLLLTLRGTPFLYAGEELGLHDAEIPPARTVDPGGRDGCRAPLPWERAAPHGWEAAPWLPWPPDPAGHSLEAQRDDPASMVHLYRRLLASRRSSPALGVGNIELVPGPDDAHILAWRRRYGDDERVVAVNFTAEPQSLPLSDGWVVELTSDATATDAPLGGDWSGTLGPDEAVVLRPG